MSAILAISLWQPWASFIAIGVKPYETRHWVPNRRVIGQRIAIHAAKKPIPREEIFWWKSVSAQDASPPLGAFVCTAILREVLPANAVEADDFGDYGEGRFAWHLTDVELIDPAIPAKGQQGFWMWERP
jgi:activating signal cointegrator 1